jgi:hypothetical protein
LDYKLKYELKKKKSILFNGQEFATEVSSIIFNEPTKRDALLIQPLIRVFLNTEKKVSMEHLKNLPEGFLEKINKQNEEKKKEKTIKEIQEEINENYKNTSVIGDIDTLKETDVEKRKNQVKEVKGILYELTAEDYKLCDNIFTNIIIETAYCNDDKTLRFTKENVDMIPMEDCFLLMSEYITSFLE